MINNLETFYSSREEVISFFGDYTEMLCDENYNVKKKKMKLREKDLKC